jgi:hypothetical protein
MHVKLTNQEIILAKFIETKSVITGFLTEAEGDKNCSIPQTYTANGVYIRMKKILDAFNNDVLKFSKELDLDT